MPPKLGQPVTFTHYLDRRRGPNRLRNWTPEDAYIATGQQAPVPGILIGVRTLSNGTVDYGWEDTPTAYYPDRDGYFTAYLIAYDLRRKPVYVLPEHTNLGDTP